MKSLHRAAASLLLAALGLVGAWAPAAAAADPPRAQLTQFACTRALDPSDRAISVRAVMRPVPFTRRLAVKFDLLVRGSGSSSATVVHAPGLATWITPTDPTLGQLPGDVWRLNKQVFNLDAPAVYQFRATFRWIGARGHVLASTIKLTRSCRQRELRPDLVVKSIAVVPAAGQPGADLYTAVIEDRGATGAGPFEVLFAPGDTSAPTIDTVQFLGSGQSRQLTFSGPVCDPASPPSVTADAASQVDDYDRANNTLRAVCPPAVTSPPAVRPTLDSMRR